MHGPKSLDIMMDLSELAFYGTAVASKAIGKMLFANHGGKPKAYRVLLERLERKGLISIQRNQSNDPTKWLPRLTEPGSCAIETENPLETWDSKWDGTWRLLTFDLHEEDSKSRARLRKWLKKLKFGKIQGSVWITHRAMSEVEASFDKLEIPPEQIACMSGEFWTRAKSRSYIEQAWPLPEIQNRYRAYLDFLNNSPPQQQSQADLKLWKTRERALWSAATQIDPMLPRELWPTDRHGTYLALEATKQRNHAKTRQIETLLASD